MKKLFMLATIAVAMLAAGQSLATIGWAGNVWPNAGSAQVPTGPFNVYVQVYKGGVTDCLLYTSPSPRDGLLSRMPSSA